MILLISDRKELRNALAGALIQRGIFGYRIPLESAAYVCRKKDTGGILLDTVTDPVRANLLFDELRREYPSLPIALLVPPGVTVSCLADAVLRETDVEELAEHAEEFYRCACGWSGTILSSYALYLGVSAEDCVYCGYPLVISPVEHRILRCLFYRYPRYTSTEDLLELCFPGEGQSIRNVSVHVGRINRAATRIAPEPLISNRYGVGYRLREGILSSEIPTATELQGAKQ